MAAQVTNPPWKVTPSWARVAGAEKIINLGPERFYAARAHSHLVEDAAAIHSVYESHPKEAAPLIEGTAWHAKDPL